MKIKHYLWRVLLLALSSLATVGLSPTACGWRCSSIDNGLNLKIAVGEEFYGISMDYIVSVGANLFAHHSLSVRINSHLRTHQLRF